MLHRDLAALLESEGLLKEAHLAPNGQEEVSSIENDSRKLGPGSVFVAVEGYEVDGHEYIDQAVGCGAISVVVSKEVNVPPDRSVFLVENTRKALAFLSAHFYGNPSKEMVLVGVTGTNGKTTTTHLVESIFRAAGMKTGLIGTIYNKIGTRELAVRHTTPESLDLQRLLRVMLDDGVRWVTLEVSSHALALERTYSCEFDLAVFTNLTQDHLDFHGNMHDYLAAKAKLFSQAKIAIVNTDDPAGDVLAKKSSGEVYTFGVKSPAFFRAGEIKMGPGGVSFEVVWQGKRTTVNLGLTGLFNVYNALAAFSVGLVRGIEPSTIVGALEGVKCVPGRFELVDKGQNFSVIIDYAHTPDGLENVLQTAREITGGKLITVFGCGGDRDRTKRPLMGEIAARCSDFSVLTSDNPRTESPVRIIEDVKKGMEAVAGAEYIVVPDRKKAIHRAIGLARVGDVIVIAGKGHETYQIIGRDRYPFDDRAVAAEALEELIKKGEIPRDRDDRKGDRRGYRCRYPRGTK